VSEQMARGVVSAEVSAIVIRADGTREDLGKIAYWHQNPVKRWWVNRRHVRKGEK
jgi:hypothetical protein